MALSNFVPFESKKKIPQVQLIAEREEASENEWIWVCVLCVWRFTIHPILCGVWCWPHHPQKIKIKKKRWRKNQTISLTFHHYLPPSLSQSFFFLHQSPVASVYHLGVKRFQMWIVNTVIHLDHHFFLPTLFLLLPSPSPCSHFMAMYIIICALWFHWYDIMASRAQ